MFPAPFVGAMIFDSVNLLALAKAWEKKPGLSGGKLPCLCPIYMQERKYCTH